VSDNVITYPDGTQKAGGSCDYCGTGIRTECQIVSADGKRSKVGCNCIEKVGDAGLLKAYKTSPEFRKALREKTAKKNAAVFEELKALVEKLQPVLATQPHPRGFRDFKTGERLTAFDSVKWLFENSGASGRASLLRALKKQFDGV
jgi:ribosome-binding protein aMBF1 (putative translation factor)